VNPGHCPARVASRGGDRRGGGATSPDHSGAKYLAHVTVGQATLEDLRDLEAEPCEPVTFQPDRFAIYHLGNNGTAQVALDAP